MDAADADHVLQFAWHALVCKSGKVYAKRDEWIDGKNTSILMHREIIRAPRGLKVDHKDGDGLNNTRGNLRTATHQQNLCNRKATSAASGYMGVYPYAKRWAAIITVDGMQHRIGVFDDPLQAAIVRDAKARELHGEFAFQNFPRDDRAQPATVIAAPPRNVRNGERNATILRMASEGLRSADIASRLSISLNTVLGVRDRAAGGPKRRSEDRRSWRRAGALGAQATRRVANGGER